MKKKWEKLKKSLMCSILKEEALSIPKVYSFLIQDLIDALNSVDYKGKENTLYQQLLNMAADGEGEI